MNFKSNSGSFKKGNIPYNNGIRMKLDLEKIYKEYLDGKSILDISKELKVSDAIIRLRLKDKDYNIRKKNEPSKQIKDKIRDTCIRKGIKPKERYSGVAWNKGLKGKEYLNHYKDKSVWNKDKIGLQVSTKKGKNFEECYGNVRAKKIKKLIKENRAKQIFPVKDTKPELKLQSLLTQLGIEFYTHQYISEIENAYQCDILVPVQEGIKKKTIIECYGTYWHNYIYGRDIDIKRCNELRDKVYRVLVFWENEIKFMELNDLNLVLLK